MWFLIGQRLLPCNTLRYLIFERASLNFNTIRLMDVLKKNSPSPQLQYQCVFCLWLLSFEARIAAQLHTYDRLPPTRVSLTWFLENTRLFLYFWRWLVPHSRKRWCVFVLPLFATCSSRVRVQTHYPCNDDSSI